jgi:hypothetical protein
MTTMAHLRTATTTNMGIDPMMDRQSIGGRLPSATIIAASETMTKPPPGF